MKKVVVALVVFVVLVAVAFVVIVAVIPRAVWLQAAQAHLPAFIRSMKRQRRIPTSQFTPGSEEWCKEQALREDFRAMMERQFEANERLVMAREDRHPHAFNDPTPAPCIDLTADDRPARGPGKKSR